MEDHLVFLYQQLRLVLDAAYAAPEWDDARIDQITADMLRLERQLASLSADGLLPSGYLGTLPTDTVRGGYAGYFQDPDGHLWEVAFNPELPASSNTPTAGDLADA